MSNQKIVELQLEGNTPAKKNSRIRTRSGSYIPNKSFYDWQESAIWQVRQQTSERFFKPVAIDITVVFGTMRRKDLDGVLTSAADMLVEALVIRDDRWQDVPQMSIRAEYSKGKPSVIIRITELE